MLKSNDKTNSAFEASWGQGVLTLISIILGACVAVGAQQVFTLSNEPDGLTILTYFHIAGAFFSVAGTFYHSYTFTSFFHVFPSLFWVILPMSVGIGVLMVCYSIGNTSNFLLSASFFFAAGSLNFLMLVIDKFRNRIGVFVSGQSKQVAFRLFLREMIKNLICFLIMLIATLYFYFKVRWSNSVPIIPDEIILSAINGIVYGFMVFRTEYTFLIGVEKTWAKQNA